MKKVWVMASIWKPSDLRVWFVAFIRLDYVPRVGDIVTVPQRTDIVDSGNTGTVVRVKSSRLGGKYSEPMFWVDVEIPD